MIKMEGEKEEVRRTRKKRDRGFTVFSRQHICGAVHVTETRLFLVIHPFLNTSLKINKNEMKKNKNKIKMK